MAVCHHHVLGDGNNSIYIFVDILTWIFFFSVLLTIVFFFLFLINLNVFPMQQYFVEADSAGAQEIALVF